MAFQSDDREPPVCASAAVVSRSSHAHDGVAGAVADALVSSERELHERALEFVAAAAYRASRVAETAPTVAMTSMSFVLAVGNQEPGVLAAGFECGVLQDCLTAAHAELPQRQRTASQKAALSSVCTVLETLPAALLDEGSCRKAASLLLSRAIDSEADISTRVHALGSLASLLEGGDAYRTGGEDGAAAEYVRLCEALLDVLSTDAQTSKQLHGRCVAALLVVLRCRPWQLPLDLAAFEADALPRSPAQYAEWVQILHEGFRHILDLAGCEGLQLPMHLGSHHLAVLLRRLDLEEDAARSAATAGSKGAAASAAPAALDGLRSLLRSQLLPTASETGAPDVPVIEEAHGGGTASAGRLVELTARCSRDGGWQLHDTAAHVLRAIGLSEAEHRSLAPSLLAKASAAGPLHRAVALALLAHCAHAAPRAVLHVVPSEWAEGEVDAALSRGGEASTCVDPLMRMLGAALRQGSTCKRNVRWLTERAASTLRAGAVEATVEAALAYPLPLAQAVLAHALDRLQQDARDDLSSACVLMRALGEAAHRTAARLWTEVRSELRRRAAARHEAEGKREEDEYDYMLAESEAAALEEEVASEARARLEHDPAFRLLPMVRACAVDQAAPVPLRAAAMSALGRYAATHSSAATELLPVALALARPEERLAMRVSATAVFGSIVAVAPSLTEPHVGVVLHGALEAAAPSCAPLRSCAHAVLVDLLQSRKLIASCELPRLLPFLLDAGLGSRTLACVQRLIQHEGPLRWTRLLYGSLMQLCPTCPSDDVAAILRHLVPATLGAARQQDIAQLGEALCSQLATEAALALATASAKGSSPRLMNNLARVFAAWPPSDRGLIALHRALGGDAREDTADGGDSALLAVCRDDESMHACLTMFAHKARATHLKGTIIDAICALLGSSDSDEYSTRKPFSRRLSSRAGEEADDGSTEAARHEDRAAAERRARDSIARLKASQDLYTNAKLPQLGTIITAAEQPAAAPKTFKRARGS